VEFLKHLFGPAFGFSVTDYRAFSVSDQLANVSLCIQRLFPSVLFDSLREFVPDSDSRFGVVTRLV